MGVLEEGRRQPSDSGSFARVVFYCVVFFGLIFQDWMAVSFASYWGGAIASLIKSIDELLVLFLFLLFFISAMKNGSVKLPLNALSLACAILFCVFSSIFYSNSFNTSVIQLFLVFKGLILLVCVANLNVTTLDVRRIIVFAFILAIALVSIALVEIFYPEEVLFIQARLASDSALFRGDYRAVSSLFVHPGQLGWFVAFICCFVFSYCIHKRNYYWFVIYFILLIVLMFTLRRKSILALVFVSFLGITIAVFQKKIKPRLLIVFVALILVVGISTSGMLSALLTDTAKHYSMSENKAHSPRVALALTSVDIAKDKFPFGVGAGRYGSWMSRVDYSSVYDEYGLSARAGFSREFPHYLNDTYWPMILGEFGMFGLMAFLVIYLCIIFKLYKSYKFSQGLFENIFSLAVLMCFLELMIESLSTPSFSKSPQAPVVFILVAFSFVLSEKRRSYGVYRAREPVN